MARKRKAAPPRWTEWCQWCVRPNGGICGVVGSNQRGRPRIWWLCPSCRGAVTAVAADESGMPAARPVRQSADAGTEGGGP